MERVIDFSKATLTLQHSLRRCRKEPVQSCVIDATVDFVLKGRNCLTYRYILFTALAAKATNPDVDILSLQSADDSDGAYDARSLCSKVVYPFQKDFLDDALDGSNEDPLVNNPGRHPRLDKNNKSANGDPRRALNTLVDNLPRVKDQTTAEKCLDYLVTKCLEMAEEKKRRAAEFRSKIGGTEIFGVRDFLSDLLDKNFGGVSLVLVTHAILSFLLPEDDGYRVIAHPANQSGASSSQFGDLDVLKGEEPFLAVELKDKPFTSVEVAKAAQTAYTGHAPSMLFVAGRDSTITDETTRYFNEAKAEYRTKGMVIGVMNIDAMLDFFLSLNRELDTGEFLSLIEETMMKVKANPEVINWVYGRIDALASNAQPALPVE